jgi:hypothetical protein
MQHGVDFFRMRATAGLGDESAFGAGLAGVLLSDWQDLPRFDAEGVKLSLGQLGLRLQNLDPTAKTYFERHRDDAKVAGIGDMSVEQAVRAIEAAVQQAFDECRVADELIDLGVPYPPDEFGFSSLQEHFSQQRRPYR